MDRWMNGEDVFRWIHGLMEKRMFWVDGGGWVVGNKREGDRNTRRKKVQIGGRINGGRSGRNS